MRCKVSRWVGGGLWFVSTSVLVLHHPQDQLANSDLTRAARVQQQEPFLQPRDAVRDTRAKTRHALLHWLSEFRQKWCLPLRALRQRRRILLVLRWLQGWNSLGRMLMSHIAVPPVLFGSRQWEVIVRRLCDQGLESGTDSHVVLLAKLDLVILEQNLCQRCLPGNEKPTAQV